MRVGVWFVAACLASAAESGRLNFAPVKREIVERRLGRIAQKVAERQAILATEFEEAGCKGESLAQQPVRGLKFPNVVCTLAGGSESVIIVGAHYDLVPPGIGAVDNWSGASMLPSLYQSLSTKARRHRFVFAGFSGEENGLQGSQSYVKAMPKAQRVATKAYVNLDCLGLGPAGVWLKRADKGLATSYAVVARAMQYPVRAINVEQVGSDDSMSFRQARIPTCSIHSVTQETFWILHTFADQPEEIRKDDYYETYRMLCAWLTYLDDTLE